MSAAETVKLTIDGIVVIQRVPSRHGVHLPHDSCS